MDPSLLEHQARGYATADQGLDRGQLPWAEPLEAQPLPREPLNLTVCHVLIIPGLAMLIRRGCW
jgi:hypothetical protein